MAKILHINEAIDPRPHMEIIMESLNEAAYNIALRTMSALGEALPWVLGIVTISDVAYAML